METYRKVLLVLVWIVAIAGIIGGLVMISYQTGGGRSLPGNSLRPFGIVLLIASIFGGIIGHFLVNVGLAIPFILLNNGDILDSMKGNTGSSSVSNSSNFAAGKIAVNSGRDKIICPFCKTKITLNIPVNEFKETKCIRCNKNITSKNVLFDEE